MTTEDRLEACPYCGREFGEHNGCQITAHLPCAETPTTDEVMEALNGD